MNQSESNRCAVREATNNYYADIGRAELEANNEALDEESRRLKILALSSSALWDALGPDALFTSGCNAEDFEAQLIHAWIDRNATLLGSMLIEIAENYLKEL